MPDNRRIPQKVSEFATYLNNKNLVAESILPENCFITLSNTGAAGFTLRCISA